MEMKRIGLYFVALMLPTGAFAQENLKENLYVEGEYVPDIVRQDKIHLLPNKSIFDFNNETPAYAFSSVVTNYRPTVYALPPLSFYTHRPQGNYKGYFDFGMGQYLNCASSAGYRFISDRDMEAGAWLQHNSTSLSKSHTNVLEPSQRRRLYDENVGVYSSKTFNNAGTLDVEANYRMAWFNYYGMSIDGDVVPADAPRMFDKAPTQTLNQISLKTLWSSIANADNVNYEAGVDVKYFGYRRGFFDYNLQGSRETDLTLHGNISKSFGGAGSLEGNVVASFLFYNKGVSTGEYLDPLSCSDYVNVAFFPRYVWSGAGLNIRAGLEVDVTANAGKLKGGAVYDKYSTMHVAPDVRAEYVAKGVSAYMGITGGTRLQTLATTSNLDLYQLPSLVSNLPLWVPVEVEMGINLGPWSGFGASLRGKYAYTKNRRLGGWTMMAIGGGYSRHLCNDIMFDENINIKGYGLGVDIEYRYGDLLKAIANLDYQPQNGTKGVFNGYDRAKWVMNAAMTYSPVNAVELTLDYNFRGGRCIYYYGKAYNEKYALASWHLKNISLLNLSALWKTTNSISIFGSINNIFGTRHDFLPCQPLEGVNIMAGVGIKF